RASHWVEHLVPGTPNGVLWLTPTGAEMTEDDWKFPEGRFLSYMLGSTDAQSPLYIVLNAAPEAIDFVLPKLETYARWERVLDTANNDQIPEFFDRSASMRADPRAVLAFAGIP